jgi:hypothetical protein
VLIEGYVLTRPDIDCLGSASCAVTLSEWYGVVFGHRPDKVSSIPGFLLLENTMRTTVAMFFLLVALSQGEDFSRHFVSATVIPIDPGLLYPDIAYEYSLTRNDAIGFASGVGLINRITYTRKIGVLCLSGSFGAIVTEHDIHRIETFTAISAEYRQPLSENLYSRIVGSGVFFEEMPYDIPVIPVFQAGFGWGF